MTKRQKKIAANEYQREGEKLEGKMAVVQRRLSAIDCFVDLDEFEEARACI